MKNKILKTVLVAFAFIFTIASMTVVFAWYTNINKIGSIDAEVSDLTLSYNIDDGEVNEKSYSVNNLAFFDLTNTNELKYFNSMVNPIKLSLNNHDNTTKAVTVSFVAKKIVKLEGEVKTSVAYPAAILSSLTDLDTSASTNVGGLIPADTESTEEGYRASASVEIAPNASSNLYIHLFGVQEIKSSDNSFLFNPDNSPVAYEFTIIIEAVNNDKNEAAIEG